MANLGDFPGKDEVAKLIIDALRQDKKDVVLNADIEAEINLDQQSIKRAKKQIDELKEPITVEVNYDVDTSKAEKKIRNLMDPLTEIERKIKSLASAGADFSSLNNAVRQYEQLKRSVSEAGKEVNKTNKYLTDAMSIINNVDSVVKGINITMSATEEKINNAFKELQSLEIDPWNIKDEKKVNDIYKQRLDIIKKIGKEKMRSHSADKYEEVEYWNEQFKDRQISFKESKDSRIYDRIDAELSYNNDQIQSAQELEILLENRLALLDEISLKNEKVYKDELKTNKVIRDRIALMKDIEGLVTSGSIKKNDIESVVFERGTLDERRDRLSGVWQDIFNLDNGELDEAQMLLDEYKKILITSASGKKIIIGPEMSEADYKAFMNIDVEKAKSIEFVRKATEGAIAVTEDYIKVSEKQNKTQEKMVETAKFIGELQEKFADRFNLIFGETMNSFGALDVSNAEAIYDALIAKEKEYYNAVQLRMQAMGEFVQVNGEIITTHQKSEPFMEKYTELTQSILDGNIGLEDANNQLKEFAKTLSVAVEKKKILFKNPENNYEKLANTIELGDYSFESNTKGNVLGYSRFEREEIAEAIKNGLQSGLDKIDITLNNGQTKITISGDAFSAAELLNKLGFNAIESEITKFIGRAFKKTQDIKYSDSNDGHWVTNGTSAYRLSRPLNEVEYSGFASYAPIDFSKIVDGVQNATSMLAGEVREAIVDFSGAKKGGEKCYVFKTEDGRFIVLRKSEFDKVKKVSSAIAFNPNGFGQNGLYNSIVYGLGADNSAVAAMSPVSPSNMKIDDNQFNQLLPAAKNLLTFNNQLDLAGIGEIPKVIAEASEATKDAVAQNERLISSYQDVQREVKEFVNLAKQIKPEETPEYAKMLKAMDSVDYVTNQEELIAEINAWHSNVQRIKTSQRNNLSVYKHKYADGEEIEHDIGYDTLEKAETKLRGYIYAAVENFGYTIANVMNDFSGKRIRAFIGDQINKYLEVSEANNAYRIDAKAFNAPIEAQMQAISSAFEETAKKLGKEFGSLTDQSSISSILANLESRVNDVNRYTLSRETNVIGRQLGIQTPYDEIQINAKKIESYEELCAVIERYHQLQERNITFGGNDFPGLSEVEEKEFQELRGRLTQTGGNDVWKQANFGEFRDIDKLATVLGVQIPQAIDETIEKTKEENKLLEEQKEKLHEIYNIAKQNQNRDLKKDQPNSIEALRQRITELQILVPQLQELQAEVSQMGIKENDENFKSAFGVAGALAKAVHSKEKDLEFYNSLLKTWTKLDSFSEYAKNKYGITTRSKKFDDGIMTQFNELVHGLNNQLSLEDAISSLDKIMAAYNVVNSHVKAEQQLGQAIDENTQKKQLQADVTKKVAAATNKQTKAEKDKVNIIQKSVDDALAQLRDAKNNKNLMIDLTGVGSPEDLEAQVGSLITKSLSSDLTVGSVTIRENIAQIGLYNEKLGITTQQVWELKKATEDATEAQLKFVKADPLVVNFKKAAQYVEAQKKLVFDSNSWVNRQLGKLDTQERAYKYSNKSIDGSTKIENFDGTAEKYIGQTLDDLADNIRGRLLQSVDRTITEEFKNTILNDLRILENEIKIQQYKEYASTTMTPTEISEARQQFEYMLDSLEAKANKNNVFDQLAESFDTLRGRLTDPKALGYVESGSDVGKFVDSLRTEKARLNAAIANAGVEKSEQQAYEKLLNLQERLYNAKKEYAKLEISSTAKESELQVSKRHVDELQKQYDASVDLIKNEQNFCAILEREVGLENELNTVIGEQKKIIQEKQIAQEQATRTKTTNEYYKNEFQNNYKYNNGKTAYDQIELDQMGDYYRAQQEQAQQYDQKLKSLYQNLLSTIQEMNKLDTKINQLSVQDGGSDLYSGWINNLQTQKSALIAELRSMQTEMQGVLSAPAVAGQSTLNAFLNDARVQAVLTSEEILKINEALMQTENIKFEFGAKIAKQVQPVIEKIETLKAAIVSGFVDGNSNYAKNILGIESELGSKYETFRENGSAFDTTELIRYTESVAGYINTLDAAIQKEQQFFAGKTKYTEGSTMSSMAEDAAKASEKAGSAQQRLTDAAKQFAKDSEASSIVITKFVTDANGISKLDFSVLKEGSAIMEKFTFATGSVTDGIYNITPAMSNAVSATQKAVAQFNKVDNLISNMGLSGIDMNMPGIQKLINIRNELVTELNNPQGANAAALSEIGQRAQASYGEVNKLYQQWLQLQNAMDNGTATQIGALTPGASDASAYQQATDAVYQYAEANGYAVESIGKLNTTTGNFKVVLKDTDGNLLEFTTNMKNLGNAIVLQQTGLRNAGSGWQYLGGQIKKTTRELMTAIVGYNIFYKAIAELRKGYNYVKELDLAMTELKKVTDETTQTYQKFLEAASKTSSEIGSTITDFTNATANFARLGYDIDQSAQMAEAAIVYKNVADGLDTVDEATESIISTMKAFGIEADDTMSIIDRYNEVGNNFAITSAGIGNALQRSASALYEAGNTLDESVALVTAANSVIQNPEQVGTALKTLALRLRGAKTELEEAGEDVDGMAESTSQLQAKLKALTHGKVDIMLDGNTFKSTTQILREMSAAWEEMTDIEQAAALELMGGKRQANILASVIKNFDVVEDVIKTSMDSEGSALAENEKYLDSIQGKTDVLTNSLQTMWNNTLSSDFLKNLLDIANAFVKITDKAGLLRIAIVALFTKAGWNSKNPIGNIFMGGSGGIHLSDEFNKIRTNVIAAGGGLKGLAAGFKGTEIAAKAAGIGAQFFNAAITMGIALIATYLIKGIVKLINKQKEAAEAAKEATTTYQSAQKTLQDQKKTIDELSSSYERLSKGVDLSTNKNVSLTTDSYEEYLDICNEIADMYPTLVTGYDAQGNAILSLKGNVDELTQAYREAAQAARQEMIASSGVTFDAFKNAYSNNPNWIFGTTGLTHQTILAKKLQELINASDDEISAFFSEFSSGRSVEIDGIEYNNIELSDTLKSIGVQTSWYGGNEFVNQWTKVVDVEKFRESAAKINSFIKSSVNKANTETSKVKSLMDAYLGEDLDYVNLSEKSRSYIDQIVSGLNADFIDGFESADTLYNWIKTNVVGVFQDSSVVDVIESLSNLQLEFDKGDISYSDYKKQLGDILSGIQNKVDEDALAQIKIGIGIDEASLETAVKHILGIVGHGVKDVNLTNIMSLSVEDLQIAGQLEVPEGTTLSWEELLSLIEETKIAATEDFDITNYTKSISGLSAVIIEYQEALQKLGKGSFTMDDFMALIEKYPELAKGVDISSNAFYGLSRNLNRAIKTSTKSFIRDLKELRATLVATGKSTEDIDQLIEAIENMPDDALDDTIQKYSTLADKIDKARLAQDKLLASMEENPNEGYETRGEAMEYMKAAMEKGEIGSESNLWNVAEKYGFTFDSAKSINENADALAKFIAIREKWFKQDDDGNYTYEGTKSFIEGVESAVANNAELQKYLTWNYDEDTGTLNFDYDNKDWDTIISMLSKSKELAGLTSDEFADLMIQVGQYFNINWGDYDDVLSHLNGIATGTSDAKTKVEEYGKAMQDYFGEDTTVDLTVRPMVKFDSTNFASWEKYYQDVIKNADKYNKEYVKNAEEQLAAIHAGDSYATVYSSTFSNEDGTKSVVVTPILPDGRVLSPEELETYANKLLAGETIDPDIDIKLAEFDGTNSVDEANEYAEALHKAQQEYDKLRDTLSINTTIDEKGIQGLAEIKEIQDSIITKADGTVVIDEEVFRGALEGAKYTEDQIDLIIDKIKKLNSGAFNIDPLKIDDALTSEGLTGLKKITDVAISLKTDVLTGITVFDTDIFSSVLQEAGYTEDQIDSLIKKIQEYEGVISTSGSTDPLGLNNANFSIDTLKASLNTLGIQFNETLGQWFDGKKDFKINVQDLVSTLKANGWNEEAIKNYCAQLSETNIEGFQVKVDPKEVDEAIAKANEIPETETTDYTVTGTGLSTVQSINEEWSKTPTTKSTEYTITETTIKKTETEDDTGSKWWNPFSWFANGTAHATGSWGASKTETALVGELGPEMLVRNGRWTTVGENGAEFTQVKRGDIIFNHKQTADLLSKGYVTGRGKLHGNPSFANGTAYAVGDGTFSRYDFTGNGGYQEFDANDNLVDSFGDAADSLSNAADTLDESADKFNEVFDWIEVRLEEFDETLGLLNAQLENASTYTAKNGIIDEMISTNQSLYGNLLAGADEYYEYAKELLTKVPEEYRAAAQDGSIAIGRFTDEVGEEALNAIQEYREWVQKGADATQRAEEVLTEIRNLAIQKIDNIYDFGSAKEAIEDKQTEKLQNAVDYIEESGRIADEAYYLAMMENSNKSIEYLTPIRDQMQAALDEAVEKGQIKKFSKEWYEQLAKLYDIDAEIDQATLELEQFQNAINDLYWDNFDQLINRIDYIKDETENLIDLMSHDDMFVKPEGQTYEGGTVKYWRPEDVEWTEEGIATMGLYAQQMETAEFKAKQYQEAINDLTAEYEAGHYSENEYLEKLNELKNAQYDCIDSYYDAKDAIVDLKEEQIDYIREGIEAEVEAYEELINKQKELLDSEKDLRDFEKSVQESEKNISDIRRKLIALENDTSMSAAAERKNLQAELAEAEYELEEKYLDRSYEDKQTALDNELEDFQSEKDAELQKWEEYLTNVELVITDSLNLVQANASGVYDTLSTKASEYGLTLSTNITTPWQNGQLAIDEYDSVFGNTMSSHMEQLDTLKAHWQEVIDLMAQAAQQEVNTFNQENANYAAAENPVEPVTPVEPATQEENNPQDKSEKDYYGVALAIVHGGYGWGSGGVRIDQLEEKGFDYNKTQDIVNKIWSDRTVHNGTWEGKYYGITDLEEYDYKKYAKGTTGVKDDEFAWIDELGDELVLHAQNGRLAYLTKGTSVIPHDISENLMELGQLDPSEVLARNTPEIGVSPSVVNNTIELTMEIGEVVHIDTVTNDTIPDLTKAVEKQLDKYMKNLNNQIRKYSR